jgi:hypothetical protein
MVLYIFHLSWYLYLNFICTCTCTPIPCQKRFNKRGKKRKEKGSMLWQKWSIPKPRGSLGLHKCKRGVHFNELRKCVHSIAFHFSNSSQVLRRVNHVRAIFPTCYEQLSTCMLKFMYSGVPIKMSFLKSQRENFQDCQLWKPSESSKIGIFPRKFYQSIIFKLVICRPNFKAKRSIDKKLFKIYQHW